MATAVFTPREIEGLIAQGDDIVIYDGSVLRLNAWKDKHPGGNFVIQHMVGRDATDEMNISHTLDTLRLVKRYRIGRTSGRWTTNFTPPIQGGVFRPLHEKDAQDISARPTSTEELMRSRKIFLNNIEEQKSLDGEVPLERKDSALDDALPAEAMLSPNVYTADRVQNDIDTDLSKYPSLDGATQQNIAKKFQTLHQQIRDEGYYECNFSEYGKEVMRYAALFALFATCLTTGWYFPAACFLGLFWHQIMFTAHDAGHRGITHNFNIDTLIGIFIADFCCGLSIGWWKSSHNVHHLVPNMPDHDPDIQNVPLFATSPSFFSSIKSTYYGTLFPWDAAAGVAVKFQKYTYYPIMAVARFNLYILSWIHLVSPRSRTKGKTWWTWYVEVAGICTYIFLYFYVVLWRSIPTWQARAIFLLTSHLITMPLHVQITLSHWGTSTADLGPSESFAQRQLRTTMDVDCPKWLDFIHGGLQFQAIHHLFPRVPRHNLRRLQSLVKQFCTETEIEYQIHGFADGNCVVLGKLQQVANQAKMLAACQAHMAATGASGLH